MKRFSKLNWLAVCAALGALAVAASQDAQPQEPQSKRVTFKSPAATLENLLPELSKSAGLTLTVSPGLSSQVLLIQVKDLPRDDLLTRIAEAAGGEWVTEGGGYKLERSTELRKALQADERKVRSAALTEALEPYLKAIKSGQPKKGETESGAQIMIDSGGPQGNQVFRLDLAPGGAGAGVITRLIQMIGVDNLAGLDVETRTVYATSANRMQKALPFGAGRVVENYVTELRQNRQSADTAPQTGGRRGRIAMGQPGNLDLVPAKAILIVTRQGFGDTLRFELVVGDTRGALVARADMMLNPRHAKASADVALDQGGARAVEPSSLATQFAKLMAAPTRADGLSDVMIAQVDEDGVTTILSSADQNQSVAAAGEWKDRIANPELNEPLAYCAGEALGKAADAAGLQIVACLPDSALAPSCATLQTSGLTAGKILTAAQTEWGLKAVKKGGLVVLLPRSEVEAVDYRLKRDLLGRTLRALATKKILSLDQRATYAAGQPIAPTQGNFEAQYFRTISSGEASRLGNAALTGERKMLRLYAALPIFQRQALGAGKSVTVGSFGLSGKNLLSDMVFNSQDGPTASSGGAGRDMRPQPPNFFGGLAVERTEMLPSGLPNNGVVTILTRERPTAFGVGKAGEFIPITGPAIRFGSENGVQTSVPRYELYLAGRLINYTFNFQLTPNVLFRRTLSDPVVDGSKPVKYDDLPADFRERLRRMEDGQIRIGVGTEAGGPTRP